MADAGRKRRWLGMSMRSLFARKKSVPKMGRFTSARINLCATLSPGKEREMVFFPKVRIEEPFAALRRREVWHFF